MAHKQNDRGWSNYQRILPQLYEQLRIPLMEYWTAWCYSTNGCTITCITNSDTYLDANIEQFCEHQCIHCKKNIFECEIFLWKNLQAIFLDLVMDSVLTYSPSAEMSQHCKEFLFWSIQPWRTLHYWTLWSHLTWILCSGSAITLQWATYAMIELSSWENLFLPSMKLDQQPEPWLWL